MNISPAYDAQYIQGGLAVLESYLLSKDLYRPLQETPPGSGDPPYPSLTPGGLLLAYQRLAGRQPPAQTAVLAAFDQQRSHWRSAWELKVGKDLHARLNQWGSYLEELREHIAEHAERYAYEVRLRVMLELLAAELPQAPAEALSLLQAQDAVLRAFLAPGEFVWQADLQPAFPRQRFPYLYGSIKKNL